MIATAADSSTGLSDIIRDMKKHTVKKILNKLILVEDGIFKQRGMEF